MTDVKQNDSMPSICSVKELPQVAKPRKLFGIAHPSLVYGGMVGVSQFLISFELGAPQLSDSLIVAVPIATASIVGVWVGYGDGLMRYLLGLIILVVSALRLNQMNSSDEWLMLFYMLALLSLVAATVAIPIGITRVWRRAHLLLLSPTDRTRQDGFQFSVWQILLVTTVIAVVLGIGRIAIPVIRAHVDSTPAIIINLGLSLGFACYLVSWSGLGQKILVKSIVALVCFVGICFHVYLSNSSGMGYLHTWMLVFTVLFLAGFIWLLRYEGWRFVRADHEDSGRQDDKAQDRGIRHALD